MVPFKITRADNGDAWVEVRYRCTVAQSSTLSQVSPTPSGWR